MKMVIEKTPNTVWMILGRWDPNPANGDWPKIISRPEMMLDGISSLIPSMMGDQNLSIDCWTPRSSVFPTAASALREFTL